MSVIVQSVWLGPRLSTMEQLCIRSYQAHGHEFHLYTYEDVEGVPEGTVIKDGRDIWLVNPDYYPSVICVSDFFRYRMLISKGGWYVDMDTVCLRPLDFECDYVFAAEDVLEDGSFLVCNNIIKAPAGSWFLWYLLGKLSGIDLSKWSWAATATGPMTAALYETGMDGGVFVPGVFNPIYHPHVPEFVSATPFDLGDAYTHHWWRGGWERRGLSTDATYHPDSLYERMKARYGV
jgi:hypothetical protein